MAIRAVLFDADEVLQYPVANRFQRLAEILGFMPEPLDAFLAELHDAEVSTLTTRGGIYDALAIVLERWEAADKARQLSEWITLVEVDVAILAIVEQLRRAGYLCALVSNQHSDRARFMSDVLGYPDVFDRCFYSCEMGLKKPDLPYFRAVLKSLELEPHEALFFDDKAENVEAARSLGILAERFVNPNDGTGQPLLLSLLQRHGVLVTSSVGLPTRS